MTSTNSKTRVVVAMSGGVDSAIASARLFDAGYDVVGVTLHLWDYPDDPDAKGGHNRCCAPEDQYDARRMADFLGFPHYTFDRRAMFAERVVAPFVDAYISGETPSPCSTCNREVKLGELFAIADRLGASHVATGHYARVLAHPDGTPCIATGLDASKDQSYFLYATPLAQVSRLMFPLGESMKRDVRAEAIARGIPGANKGESQELCFVGAGDHAYAAFVEERAKDRVRPGPILNDSGEVVGAHSGVHRFTIGQRKGVGVALGAPAFVTAIDANSGTVHVGDGAALQRAEADLEEVVIGAGVELPRRATVRIRYRHEGSAATVTGVHGGAGKLVFDNTVRALTKGQIAVFYDGERVIGGGRITHGN